MLSLTLSPCCFLRGAVVFGIAFAAAVVVNVSLLLSLLPFCFRQLWRLRLLLSLLLLLLFLCRVVVGGVVVVVVVAAAFLVASCDVACFSPPAQTHPTSK